MAKFAKLFVVGDSEQLLLIRKFDEEDRPVAELSTDVDTAFVSLAMTFKKEEQLDEYFNTFDHAKAESARAFLSKPIE